MKLRNKKTGEIGDIAQTSADCIIVYYPIVDGIAINPQKRAIYTSLDQLNEEWEDYEEPKESYFIDSQGDIQVWRDDICDDWSKEKQIGNYFDTLEEAEKAVEKLKAWKRLKDKGFRFDGWEENHHNLGIIEFSFSGVEKSVYDFGDDLNLLFGGEE